MDHAGRLCLGTLAAEDDLEKVGPAWQRTQAVPCVVAITAPGPPALSHWENWAGPAPESTDSPGPKSVGLSVFPLQGPVAVAPVTPGHGALDAP